MKEYHILSLSGGKDSTALAFFMKENMEDVFDKTELVFCDTEKEIPETYDYLNKIEVFLNRKVNRIKPEKSFDHLYQMYNILPSVNRRWCTVHLKTKAFKDYIYKKIGKDICSHKVFLYIGIRSDEEFRVKRSRSEDSHIVEKFPFVEYGVNKQDVEKILIDSGIGYPDYYRWRKRSGCYFCMFQSKMDWVNLYEHHPDLFKKAMEYEFVDNEKISKGRFGWNIDMPLQDIIRPENIKKIKENYQKLKDKNSKKKIVSVKIYDMFS